MCMYVYVNIKIKWVNNIKTNVLIVHKETLD